jgi:hypothetical protein
MVIQSIVSNLYVIKTVELYQIHDDERGVQCMSNAVPTQVPADLFIFKQIKRIIYSQILINILKDNRSVILQILFWHLLINKSIFRLAKKEIRGDLRWVAHEDVSKV